MYYFHADAGHGWLAVKRSELKRLGLLSKISFCSFERGETVYLEEDCDMMKFIKAKREIGEEIKMKESYQEHSQIRGYATFTPE